MQRSLPFVHDTELPPWEHVKADRPRALRQGRVANDRTLAVRRTFQNTVQPGDVNALRLTITEEFPDADSVGDRQAVQEPLLRQLDLVRLYYTRIDTPAVEGVPAGVALIGEQEAAASVEEEVGSPFAGIFAAEPDSQGLLIWTLEVVGPRPRASDPPVVYEATVDPGILAGQIHGYVAKCTTSAWASVRTFAGSVRLRAFRNGVDLGAAVDVAGGDASNWVGASTATRATYDVAVRGLSARSDYRISLGWVRGRGGGC
jgi:hypothetical protein